MLKYFDVRDFFGFRYFSDFRDYFGFSIFFLGLNNTMIIIFYWFDWSDNSIKMLHPPSFTHKKKIKKKKKNHDI